MDENSCVFGSFPPPRANDTLFGGVQEDWPLNACLTIWGDAEYAYKEGFRTAAQQLTSNVCKKPVDQDLIIYPIAYLYRHHIELVLKDLYRCGIALLDQAASEAGEMALRKHGLNQLWDQVKPLINSICKSADVDQLPIEDLEGISSYITQLSSLDPDGQRFRYATYRRKKPNAPRGTFENKRSLEDENLVRINIRQFSIHMEQLAEYLGRMEEWFGMLYEAKAELENSR